ncbi:hypothetical protein GJ496_009231 [Pomphorhynchus laevis]|nr:hypothetical protein GJ496_009231 [Pomphorhynchus laevis]
MQNRVTLSQWIKQFISMSHGITSSAMRFISDEDDIVKAARRTRGSADHSCGDTKSWLCSNLRVLGSNQTRGLLIIGHYIGCSFLADELSNIDCEVDIEPQ